MPGELPCPTKESNKILLEILWSARNHGIEEIIVPKKVKISFDDRLLDISKFLVPKSVPEDYCWEETDTSFVFRLSSLSELPTGARGAGCSCFSSLDTVISDEDTDVEDSGEESGHDDSGYLDDHQGTSLIKLPISWKAVYDSESGQEYHTTHLP